MFRVLVRLAFFWSSADCEPRRSPRSGVSDCRVERPPRRVDAAAQALTWPIWTRRERSRAGRSVCTIWEFVYPFIEWNWLKISVTISKRDSSFPHYIKIKYKICKTIRIIGLYFTNFYHKKSHGMNRFLVSLFVLQFWTCQLCFQNWRTKGNTRQRFLPPIKRNSFKSKFHFFSIRLFYYSNFKSNLFKFLFKFI